MWAAAWHAWNVRFLATQLHCRATPAIRRYWFQCSNSTMSAPSSNPVARTRMSTCKGSRCMMCWWARTWVLHVAAGGWSQDPSHAGQGRHANDKAQRLLATTRVHPNQLTETRPCIRYAAQYRHACSCRCAAVPTSSAAHLLVVLAASPLVKGGIPLRLPQLLRCQRVAVQAQRGQRGAAGQHRGRHRAQPAGGQGHNYSVLA